MSRLSHYLASTVIVVVLVEEKSAILALAVRNRSYTGKTHLHGFQTLNFLLAHAGGSKAGDEIVTGYLKCGKVEPRLYFYEKT
jgi:hypothetical protein